MMEPQATATVTLFPTDKGGRAGPTPVRSYSCVLKIAGGNHDVRMLLGKSLEPGTESQVGLVFLDGAKAKQFLRTGMRFDVWEGKVVGSGEVTDVTEIILAPRKRRSGKARLSEVTPI